MLYEYMRQIRVTRGRTVVCSALGIAIISSLVNIYLFMINTTMVASIILYI